jgi:hypothetical protein
MSDWPPVARNLHLLGGLRAINNPGPIVEIVPTTPGGKGVGYKFANHGDLIAVVRDRGLKVIGCDFYTDPDQVQELRELDWRPLMPQMTNFQWPATDVRDMWRHIGHEAARRDSMSVFEKARHISMQLDLCVWRLRDLSEAYYKHLKAACFSGKFKPTRGTAGQFTQFIFFSAHAMFAELASLRDHLAMFAAREILGISGYDNWPRLELDNAFKNSSHPLAVSLRRESQWLELFNEYRNLFVHNAPMGTAQGVAMVEHSTLDIPPDRQLPTVSLALPSDPAALRRRLRSEIALRSYEHWVEIAQAPNSGPDALAYCHQTLTQMVHLAHEVAKHSPVPPVIPVIAASDTLDGIEVTRELVPAPVLPIPKPSPKGT